MVGVVRVEVVEPGEPLLLVFQVVVQLSQLADFGIDALVAQGVLLVVVGRGDRLDLFPLVLYPHVPAVRSEVSHLDVCHQGAIEMRFVFPLAPRFRLLLGGLVPVAGLGNKFFLQLDDPFRHLFLLLVDPLQLVHSGVVDASELLLGFLLVLLHFLLQFLGFYF